MEYVKLNNDVLMPMLGCGVYQVDPKTTQTVVSDALEVGYRAVDTAAVYLNEEGVGRAIKESGIPRKELFVTTKLWVQDAGYELTKTAFDRSMKKLQLDYLDLYLIHQPYGDYYGAWHAMEELYDEGRIRAIGVSNFATDRLLDLMMHNRIKPAVNQIETHPFYQRTDDAKFMADNGVQIESWGPFAEGKNGIFQNELLLSIGRKYNKSVAQVILRWLIQRRVVVIPKSVRKERLAENFQVFDFYLSDKDMEAIKGLDTGKSIFLDHRDPEAVQFIGNIKF